MSRENLFHSVNAALDMNLFPRGMEEQVKGLGTQGVSLGAMYVSVLDGVGIGVLLGLKGEVRGTKAVKLGRCV